MPPAGPWTKGGMAMRLKKTLATLLCLLILGVSSTTVFAAEGNVTYSGNAGAFIFAPDSEYSPTDLFPNFKSVMPGDRISQQITVRNDANKKVKVKVYMRALGAHADSEAFLSQLNLEVVRATDTVMFDAPADQTAQLTDWVCLGTLYSGGEETLTVVLDVPVSLENAYQDQIGYLDWEFAVEEFAIEEGDPESPPTGDSMPLGLLVFGLLLSGAALLGMRSRKRM